MSDGLDFCTIPEILAGKKKWNLRAEVFSKPGKINRENPILNIKIRDLERNIIQAVFFGDVAIKYFEFLQANKLYVFSGGNLQKNKMREGEF